MRVSAEACRVASLCGEPVRTQLRSELLSVRKQVRADRISSRLAQSIASLRQWRGSMVTNNSDSDVPSASHASPTRQPDIDYVLERLVQLNAPVEEICLGKTESTRGWRC